MTELKMITANDQGKLWEALYIALWDSPDEPRRPRSCLKEPHVSVYAHAWGSQDMDLGLKSVSQEGETTGMIWSRYIPDQMGAHLNEETPQLGFAVFPGFQGLGIGQRLMRAYLVAAADRFPGISLGVHPENEVAISLYKKCGFETFAIGPKGYLHMHHGF